jgi:hypothetical protein
VEKMRLGVVKRALAARKTGGIGRQKKRRVREQVAKKREEVYKKWGRMKKLQKR